MGFIASALVVGLALRAVLGNAAGNIAELVLFGAILLVSAVITGILAWLGTRDGGPTRGRHEVSGQPLERVAALEAVAGVALVIVGIVQG